MFTYYKGHQTLCTAPCQAVVLLGTVIGRSSFTGRYTGVRYPYPLLPRSVCTQLSLLVGYVPLIPEHDHGDDNGSPERGHAATTSLLVEALLCSLQHHSV